MQHNNAGGYMFEGKKVKDRTNCVPTNISSILPYSPKKVCSTFLDR